MRGPLLTPPFIGDLLQQPLDYARIYLTYKHKRRLSTTSTANSSRSNSTAGSTNNSSNNSSNSTIGSTNSSRGNSTAGSTHSR